MKKKYLLKSNNSIIKLSEDELIGLDNIRLLEVICSSNKELLDQLLSLKKDKKKDKLIKELETSLSKLNVLFPGVLVGVNKLCNNIAQA